MGQKHAVSELDVQLSGSQVFRHCGRIGGQGASGTEDGLGEEEETEETGEETAAPGEEAEAAGEETEPAGEETEAAGLVWAGPPWVLVHFGQKVLVVVMEIVETVREVSMEVTPEVTWVVVTGQVVTVSSTTTVVRVTGAGAVVVGSP
jgi:hypothetical protein